jgi:hypothetical protein
MKRSRSNIFWVCGAAKAWGVKPFQTPMRLDAVAKLVA